MKATIFLNEENHNPISLDGTLIEFMQGSSSSTLIMKGGENNKKLRELFAEIRNDIEGNTDDHFFNKNGLVKDSICILSEDDTEILCFPSVIRVHII